MPSEAEVFLNHLNACTSVAPPGQVPDNIRYLQERIAAVRHENRDLREQLEKIHKDYERLRQAHDQVVHDNQRLQADLQRAQDSAQTYEEQSRVRGHQLEEIWASRNWKLANRLQRARLAVTRWFRLGRAA